MAHLIRRAPNFLVQLKKIEVEDLDYVEKDLCFYELVSIGFLLYGEDRTNAAFILQKLLVLSNSSTTNQNADILRRYTSVNPRNWRSYLVEALAVVGARRVLHKLGFQWEELRQQFLPHVSELSLYIHPLLKALYKMCERLTPAQAGRLVLQINEQRKRPEEHLRFYDFAYMEVFLLDWLSCRIISVGDANFEGTDVQVLLEYFKGNDMDAFKYLLLNTINSNLEAKSKIPAEQNDSSSSNNDTSLNNSIEVKENINNNNYIDNNNEETPIASTNDLARYCEIDLTSCYNVRRDQAGFVLIINQKEFYEEPAEELRNLLPRKKLTTREGTDIDKQKLKEVFTSFGYTPLEHDNVNHIQLLHCIRETVKRAFLFDSLVVCILSHGIDGAVYGTNSIPVQLTEIEHIMTAETLQGKPKMLIVQACQTDEETTEKNHEKKKYLKAIDSYADMLIAMSTLPGYVSIRHTATGTWFIQEFCDAVNQLGDRKHMLDILTTVNAKVSKKRGDKNEKMLPFTKTILTKEFRLPPRK